MIRTTLRFALLIIDMQNDFADPNTRLYSKRAQDLIPVINTLTGSGRSNNVPVIWVNQEHRRQLVDFGREGDISLYTVLKAHGERN